MLRVPRQSTRRSCGGHDHQRDAHRIEPEPYSGPTDAASIKNLIIGERQRVLFVEGFRAFDVERFNLDLAPAPGSSYRFGGVYGNTVCLPLPDVERAANAKVDPKTLISGVRGQFALP